jgi:hypothetical protein
MMTTERKPLTAAMVAAKFLNFTPIGSERITLKKLKVSRSLSEETTAFTADVYFDGKMFHASNRGNGGANSYHGDRATIDAAEAYAATLPLEFDSERLDHVIGDHIEKADLKKQIVSACKRHLCFVLPSDDLATLTYRSFSGPADEAARKQTRAKYPDAIILNDFPEMKALIGG